jgi:hypothetical protein
MILGVPSQQQATSMPQVSSYLGYAHQKKRVGSCIQWGCHALQVRRFVGTHGQSVGTASETS